MEPPHQRLGTSQDRRIRTDIELRLIIYFELILRDGGGKILDELLRVELLLMQGLIVIPDHTCIDSLDGIRCHLGAVEALLHLHRPVCVEIDAHAEPHAVLSRVLPHKAGSYLLHELLIVLPVRTVDHKGVRLPAANDPSPFVNEGLYTVRDLFQHDIPVCLSIALVEHPEVVDVHDDGIGLNLGMMRVILLCVTVKVFLVIQTGEGIPLGVIDDVPVLKKLNGPAQPRQDNADGRIGLRNKVDSAKFQALDLGLPFRRRHDDRDPGELVVRLDLPEDIQSRLHGHKDIQEHQGQRISVLPHLFQRLFPVAGEEDVIIPLQHLPQDLPVDQLILRDQDLPLASC